MQERYFYHSFPRRGGKISTQDHQRLGMAILASVLESGLLLTPEIIRWSEACIGGEQARPVDILQKRICFTELAPSELAEHASVFGHFALEFSIEDLQGLGAMPVFYVPGNDAPSNGLRGAGSALIMSFVQIEALLVQLLAIKNCHIPRDANPAAVESLHAIQSLIDRVVTKPRSLEQLRFAIIAAENLFSKTENKAYTQPLGYYRQREWRIISNFALNDTWSFRELSAQEKTKLLTINPFFGKPLVHDSCGECRNVDQSMFFTELLGRRVIERVRRIIVPRGCLSDATDLVTRAGLSIAVDAAQLS